MRARALFVGTLGAFLLAVATPATAKPMFDQVQISGPGLGGSGLLISRSAADWMWEAGLDRAIWDDPMAGSIGELGLTATDLGPRYVVRYRFDVGPGRPPKIVQQNLYPYAKRGPVTYTPPEQRLFGRRGMTITAGWYQTSPGVLRLPGGAGTARHEPRGRQRSPVRPGYRSYLAADALGLDRAGARRACGLLPDGGSAAASPRPRPRQRPPLRSLSGPGCHATGDTIRRLSVRELLPDAAVWAMADLER